MTNAVNQTVSPQNAILGHWNGAAVTACTTRAPTATASLAGANISLALDANSPATDQKISKIAVKGISTSFTAATVAQIVMVWHYDGTNAYLIDEIIVTAVTPSTTVASFYGEKIYNDLVLPAGHKLYMSTSITTTASTTALQATIHGASL